MYTDISFIVQWVLQCLSVLHGYTDFQLLSLDCFADDDNRIVLKPLADASDCQRDYIN